MHVLTVLCRGGWMPGNLSEGWRRLGCTVEEFFYGTHMGRSWDRDGAARNRAINAELLATAQRLKSEGRLDLVFMVIYDDVLDVDTARKLRALGVPLVNYHVDLVGQWYRVLRTAKYFDRIACAHRDHWGALARAGARPCYMPMAANPLPEPAAAQRPDCAFPGVLYLGSPMPFRRQVLGELVAAGLPVRIFGHNWEIVLAAAREGTDPLDPQSPGKNLHDARHYLLARLREEGPGEVLASLLARAPRGKRIGAGDREIPPGVLRGVYASEDFASLVRGAAINLGFTHFKGAPGTAAERRQVRLREFEIPMAGGFYLTQDCPQLRELFEVGCHIDTWDSTGELLEKCRHYLEHDDLRRRMALAARAHCLANHTWERRLAGLLADLGLTGPRPGQAPSPVEGTA